MIEANLGGRLGNQMFQYSVARIIAEKNGYNFFVPDPKNPPYPYPDDPSHHISNFFPDIELGKNDGDIKRYHIENTSIQKFDPSIFDLLDYTKICGFWQSEKYLLGYEDKIKNWFKVEMDSDTKKMIKKFDINEYCYIHMRGGDYKDHGHWLLTEEYYSNAMSKIKEIKKDIKFLIITDDVESSKDIFPDIEIISNEMMVDFKMLYYSKYCIISNSTFSWWASWLSNKEISVAPNYWLNHNKPELGFYPIDIKSEKFIYV